MKHEAVVETDKTEQPPGSVVQVLEDGYMINDRLLRPACAGGGKGDQYVTLSWSFRKSPIRSSKNLSRSGSLRKTVHGDPRGYDDGNRGIHRLIAP
jgi:hypothetical protein